MACVGIGLRTLSQSCEFMPAVMNLGGSVWKIAVMISVVLAGWTTNNGNLYSAVQALRFKKDPLSFPCKIWIVGVASSILACFNFLHHIEIALDIMGMRVATLGAVILVAFFKEAQIKKHAHLSNYARHDFWAVIAGTDVGSLSHLHAFSASGYSFIDELGVTLFICAAHRGELLWKKLR